jgi:hypothetical protein
MGRCQRGICYALMALGEASTKQILEWCYEEPAKTRRQRKNRARRVVLTARRMAIRIGRVWPGGTLWRLAFVYSRRDQVALIDEEKSLIDEGEDGPDGWYKKTPPPPFHKITRLFCSPRPPLCTCDPPFLLRIFFLRIFFTAVVD